jgi:bidirectional [NiFe] hydrogenase diaphorase subunit
MLSETLEQLAQAARAENEEYDHHIIVCVGTACHAAQSEDVRAALDAEVKRRGLTERYKVTFAGCRGMCAAGPMVSVHSQDMLYHSVEPADAGELMDSLEKDEIDQRLNTPLDRPFFTEQSKVVLEHAGSINPERIEDYLAVGGYTTILKVLHEMTPAEVIDQIMRSGLRGRGGAGYPTGLKWSTVAKAAGSPKYVICNGDEGDPGAFMDRSIMESDPHHIIEGILIAAYAVGAEHGYIYIRAEYPLAVKRLNMAIKQAQKQGLLGKAIGDSKFSFDLEVRLGAGAFVCGEETALIASIEGRRGNPRPRPPYPAESGLWGHPTLINNVETFANIVPIIREGADWFASIGTEKSKGTKVFALTGKIANTGLIEVPMGISLRKIIFDIGGGIPDGHTFKAVQTGGPSGGCIPAEYLDMTVDYESLAKVGSIMGSGGMIVMDDTTCMVDIARYFIEFCMSESCGKCIPCRVGTAHMFDLLDKITHGTATLDDLALLEELCDMVKHTSLCGLGQSAPNPVISTLRYFRDEYLAHIVDKVCPAGVCPIHQTAEAAR